MSSSLATIEAQALLLTEEERVVLADHLLASVGAAVGVVQAWAEEADRRLAEVEAGAPSITLDAAIARARQALA